MQDGQESVGLIEKPPFGFLIEGQVEGPTLFTFRIHDDFINVMMAHPERWQMRLQTIVAPWGSTLVVAVGIQDDVNHPYMIFRHLDERRRLRFERAVDAGRVDVRFLDYHDRHLGQMELVFSPEPGCFAMLRHCDYASVPDPRSDNWLVERARRAYDEAGLAWNERGCPDLPLVSFSVAWSHIEEEGLLPHSKEPIRGVTGPIGPFTGRRLGLKNDGAYLEYDVADLLMRVFPPEWVFIKPILKDNGLEISDVLVITPTDVFAVECKKPEHRMVGDEAAHAKAVALREQRARKGLNQIQGTAGHLTADHLDVRFANDLDAERRVALLREMERTNGLPFEILEKTFRVSAKGKRIRLLVVLTELHPESLDNLSVDALKLMENEAFPPLAVFDVLKLVNLVNVARDPSHFFSLFDGYVSACRGVNRLLDVRFTTDGDGLLPVGPGALDQD